MLTTCRWTLRIGLTAAVALAGSAACAQGVWVQRLAAAPPSRSDHAMAGDTGRGLVTLFGGTVGSSQPVDIRGDTWEWNGAAWTQRAPAVSPPGRMGHAMAYDPVRARGVLFGGWSGMSALGDTWEWDGVNWALRSPATSPSGRYSHAMAFDAARGRVVLFGGTAGGAETWEWDGANWIQRTPATSPSSRYAHAMAYDAARARVVLFGGSNGATSFGDTWEWDGANWTQRAPATSPAGRNSHAMSFDSFRGRVVLFGGRTAQGGKLAETWEWDGTTWRAITCPSPGGGPSARAAQGGVSYHAIRGRMVLFGGFGGGTLGDTWEYVPHSFVLSAPLGPGSLQFDNFFCGEGGQTYVTALSVNTPGRFPNGWFYGVDVPIQLFLVELNAGPPFLGLLGPTGLSSLLLSAGIPAGLLLHGVTATFDAGTGLPRSSSPPIAFTTP